MNDVLFAVKALIVVAAGVYASVVPATTSIALGLLFVLIGLDTLTGIIAAAMEGKISSHTAWKGGAKKAGTLILIGGVILTENAIIRAGMATSPSIASIGEVALSFSAATVAWFCVQEAISVLENSVRLGVEPPSFVRRVLGTVRDRLGPG